MPRHIVFGDDLRALCSKTMNLLSKAVVSSLGPSGKLSLLDRPKQGSLITKDGVTIARFCLPLPDESMNLIGGKIIEIANKTNSESGDGTTTSIVLAHALYTEALKFITEKRVDPVKVKDEIEATLPLIFKELQKMATPIESEEDMAHVATISANNDHEIGALIAKAIESAGQDGFVTLTEGNSEKATLEIKEGMQITKGAFSERYLKGQTSMEFDNPKILLFDGKIDDPNTLNDLYAQVPNQPFVVIAELSDLAQEFLVNNARAGGMTTVHIQPPMYKETRVKILQDIAVAVGADLVSPYKHDLSKPLPAEVLGSAKKITFNKYNTNIIEGAGHKDDILQRVDELKEEIEATRSMYEQDQIRERISRLTSGAAVIGVGGRTEDEILERKDRFEDALNATRSALLEGVIPGGGYTLFKIAQKLKGESIGVKIFKVALEAPMRTIISNTGMDVQDVVDQVRNSNKGYDAREHKLVNLTKKGILDPVKSTKSGLKNAVSIVDLLINLEVLSVNIIDKDNIKEVSDVLRGINPEDI